MLMFAALPLTAIVSGPLGEELGWRGFLLPHLLQRYSAIAATALLVPMWLAFHLPLSIVNPDRYGPLWALNVTGIAITMTWLHLRTAGSVLLAVVFHAVANTSTGAAVMLFPEDERPVPWAIATGMWLLVAAAVVWGPLRHAAAEPARPRRIAAATETSTRKDPHDRRTTPQ
jgi:membrane protease YdiL (CAAX protease family)